MAIGEPHVFKKTRYLCTGWYRVFLWAKWRTMENEQYYRVEPTVDYGVKYDYSDVPTIYNFSQDSESIMRGLMGPFGSGKSSGAVMEIVKRSQLQAPGRDGVRRTRWAAVRNTNRDLDDTTLVTWFHWIKEGQFGFFEKTPRNFILQLKCEDGSYAEAEILFRPLDKPDDVDNLMSLELTGCWFNEVRYIPKLIWDTMIGRIGRYPAMKEGGPTWAGIIGDTNPPDTDHWFYTLFEDDKPRRCSECTNPDGGFVMFVRDDPRDYSKPLYCPKCGRKEEEGIPMTAIYKQPSGRSQEAENLRNLPRGYYSNLMVGKDQGWITVYVDGKYGYVRDGKPVYMNWTDTFHLAPKDLEPHRSYPLICGYDCTGRNQAWTVNQWLPNGRFHTYDEVFREDTDVRTFLSENVKPFMQSKYAGLPLRVIGDPAGKTRSDTDSSNALKEAKLQKIIIHPAYSNTWDSRYGAVNRLLIGSPIDGKGRYQLNPRCKILHKGFLGEYRLARVQVTGQERYKDQPEKNKASHLHDSLQYAAMGTERGLEEFGRSSRPARSQPPPPSMGAFT